MADAQKRLPTPFFGFRKAIFANTSSLANEIAGSADVSGIVEGVVTANTQAVRAWFSAHPSEDVNTFTWSLPSLIRFSWECPDLKLALGDTKFQGAVDVMVIRDRNDGSLHAVVCTVKGQLTDLYDFDYSSDKEGATFIRQAAALQAGFGTLGVAGHVFKTEVDLDNQVPINPPTF